MKTRNKNAVLLRALLRMDLKLRIAIFTVINTLTDFSLLQQFKDKNIYTRAHAR